MAHVIFVSAQGPNPSFFFFWGTFIRLGGSDLDQGLTKKRFSSAMLNNFKAGIINHFGSH